MRSGKVLSVVLALYGFGALSANARLASEPQTHVGSRVLQPRIAQAQVQPTIRVAETAVADNARGTPLAIQVGPVDTLPPNSFIRLRGLPPDTVLSAGFVISAGLWAVPLNALPALRMKLPANAANDLRITITLATVDGKVHAETTASVAIQPPVPVRAAEPPRETTATAPAAATPVEPSARNTKSPAVLGFAPGRVPREATGADRQQALALHAKGQEQMARGNVYAARMFFQRAATAGLAESALELAGTYDPEELSKRKVLGLQADRAEARRWYELARDLGATEAAARLRRLADR